MTDIEQRVLTAALKYGEAHAIPISQHITQSLHPAYEAAHDLFQAARELYAARKAGG